MNKIPLALVFALPLFVVNPVIASSGGLDAFNCHVDTRINHYHCHQSPVPKPSHRKYDGVGLGIAAGELIDAIRNQKARELRKAKANAPLANVRTSEYTPAKPKPINDVSDTEQARKDAWFKARMQKQKDDSIN